MEKQLVSIIVPCYKQADYLSETLDSVSNQTYQNWECVIVNDGSPDNTEEIAKKYLDKDRRFKYIGQENKGLSSARNTGIANSEGEYILPLDADDKIGSTYLEKAIARFEEVPETKLVYCKAELFGEEYGIWNLPTYDYENIIWNNCIFCSAMYRRSDFDSIGGYKENMTHGFEDWDLWLALLKKEDIVYRIDEVLFYYRVKEVSMSTELTNFKQDTLVQLCKNHPEVYEPYKEYVLMYHKQLDELFILHDEYKRVCSSHAYRLGKFLLKPFTWMRKLRS